MVGLSSDPGTDRKCPSVTVTSIIQTRHEVGQVRWLQIKAPRPRTTALTVITRSVTNDKLAQERWTFPRKRTLSNDADMICTVFQCAISTHSRLSTLLFSASVRGRLPWQHDCRFWNLISLDGSLAVKLIFVFHPQLPLPWRVRWL